MKLAYVLAFSAALLLSPATAPAQTTATQFHSQAEYDLAHSLFNKLHTDLNAAQTSTSPYLFDQARAELNALETNWDAGIYDSRQMDRAVTALEIVADRAPQLQNGANIASDISRLLDLRRQYY